MTDSAFTCKNPKHKTSEYHGDYSGFVDKSFVQFLESERGTECVDFFFSESYIDKQLTRSQLPAIVKEKTREIKLLERQESDKKALEAKAAEDRKKLMAIYPPDYNASSLDEFAMMISDKKLQEARKKLEETDKAWLAEKIAKKRPVAYLPEAKEPAELSPLEMNPNYIPIPNIQALFPFCSSQHNAFASLCKFLNENRGLERQICEVCEQIVNCFGKAQCPVTKLRGGLVIFETEDGTCNRTNAFEAYINNRYRVIFIKNPDGGIIFTHFGVHTI